MEQNSDHEMDDFMEGIDDELQEERDESLSRRSKPGDDSDSTVKLLILAAVGVLVLIVLMVSSSPAVGVFPRKIWLPWRPDSRSWKTGLKSWNQNP